MHLETIKIALGGLILITTIYLLIKRYDTRTVLIGSGLLLCLISLTPMAAFNAFSERMTTAGLIQSICASMGFAFVMKYTRCDMHLVKMLTRGMSTLGFVLIPVTVVVTFVISIAIPSAAGVSAAVGATLIPLLIAARIHPAIAAGAIITGTIGATLNPGVAHNAQIAGIAGQEIVPFILYHLPVAIGACAIGAVGLTIMALVRKEINLTPEQILQSQDGSFGAKSDVKDDLKVNVLYAIAPFLPVALLVASSMELLGSVKLTVPASMILGSLYAIIVTRSHPSNVTKEFFNGMGSAYANILGIIIAAAVFIEGLKACGLIGSFIQLLIDEPQFAQWGGTIGPFIMGVVTGTGDATAFAFNEAVTPHASSFGYEPSNLGSAVMYAACLGRNMSPVAGATIVCAGIACINPIEIVKRTALGMICSVLAIVIFWM